MLKLNLSALCILALPMIGISQSKEQTSDFEILDYDRDGIVSFQREDQNREYKDICNDLDKNKNSIIEFSEADEVSTPAKVFEPILEHPNVKTMEMIRVPGSIDDVSNLRASLYVRRWGLNTKINQRSIIASGGIDFFLAGKTRTVAKGAKIGVHSWGSGGKPATELPKSQK